MQLKQFYNIATKVSSRKKSATVVLLVIYLTVYANETYMQNMGNFFTWVLYEQVKNKRKQNGKYTLQPKITHTVQSTHSAVPV